MKLENIILFIYNMPVIKKYRLQKFNNFLQPVNLNRLIPLIDTSEEKETIRKLVENNTKSYKEAYDSFKKVLEQNFDLDDLHNFYYNSEWVKVYMKNFNLNPFKEISGRYSHEKNKLYLNKNHISKSSNHEFFHLSSTNYDSAYISSGFSIDIDNNTFGNGINEGYTDLLTKRYFNEGIENSYFYEAKFASNLEKIVGQKKMEKLYLRGDFFGLIKELEKYYTIQEIERFLINIDVISLYNSSYLSKEEALKFNLLIEDCICFLIKGFSKILKDRNYSIDVNKEYIENYFYDMKFFHCVYDINYKFNMERINKIIEENLCKEVTLDIYNEEKVCYNK